LGSVHGAPEGTGFKIKRVELKPGAAPTHAQRSEHWIVISGEARVTHGDRVYAVRASESTCLPAGSPHRLENLGPGPLLVIEVQCGKYLGEDDIVDSDTC
jgi:mannose-6-phosphate isomerase-like protein (cupin superfamily)